MTKQQASWGSGARLKAERSAVQAEESVSSQRKTARITYKYIGVLYCMTHNGLVTQGDSSYCDFEWHDESRKCKFRRCYILQRKKS